jgi:hypothetical protein
MRWCQCGGRKLLCYFAVKLPKHHDAENSKFTIWIWLLTPVAVKSAEFCVVIPCSSEGVGCYGRTYRLHLHQTEFRYLVFLNWLVFQPWKWRLNTLPKSRDLSKPHDFTARRTKISNFAGCFHGYENGFLSLTEEHKLKFFLNKGVREIYGPEKNRLFAQFRIVHIEDFYADQRRALLRGKAK